MPVKITSRTGRLQERVAEAKGYSARHSPGRPCPPAA
jgi:hypothetical protein